jgi:hypothetical protein
MRARPGLTLCSGLLFLAVSSVWGADASTLTSAQAEASMKSALRKNPELKNVDALKVNKVHGCVPAFGRPATDFLCVLDWHSPAQGVEDAKEIPVPFRHKDGTWTVLEDFDGLPAPACPSLKEAQQLLRTSKKNDSLVVTGEIDDGEGLFSAERGMMRDKKGPLRIMCRYEVESKISERMAISYFWYENGKYRLDEVEDWFD